MHSKSNRRDGFVPAISVSEGENDRLRVFFAQRWFFVVMLYSSLPEIQSFYTKRQKNKKF